ncbi:MAG TPA: isochorismate synthase [Bacteroidetes bacterium]|nr:isochorismate synthase [Bacteroidota bacterium]
MEQITNAIRMGLEKDIPFIAYCLPGKKQDVHVIMQPDGDTGQVDITEMDGHSGFFIAPFDSADDGKMNLIRPDLVVTENGESVNLDRLVNLPDGKTNSFSIANHEMSKEEYLSRAAFLVKMLDDDVLEKIVLSRMINLPHIPGFQPIGFFLALLKKYREAFVYLFNLPGQGIWAGATPETLLNVTEKTAETVALAGTRPMQDIKWTKKEINEQQIVTDFVKEVLEDNGIKYLEKGPATIMAGNLVHLKTSFLFNPKALNGKAGKLIKALHPTPAVCGYPKTAAFDLIKKVEKHERRFYTGFLGPWNLNGHSHLFVNLRCAEMGDDELNLYVGGGITTDSDPEAEWEETVSKSQTLLTVVEKL